DVEFDQQYKEMKTKEEEVLRDSLLKLYQELKGQTKEIKTEEETRKKFELLFPEAIRRSVNDNRHSRAIYHSRLLNTKGLPCPQNNHSQEWQASTFLELLRNSQSGNKVSRASISQPVESISVYLTEQVENLNIQEDSTETSLQAQIQISPNDQELLQELSDRIECSKIQEKDSKIISLKISEEKLFVQLEDGRELSIPIN
ncbi:5873_t:CDS:2, partial [Racocetra persica]